VLWLRWTLQPFGYRLSVFNSDGLTDTGFYGGIYKIDGTYFFVATLFPELKYLHMLVASGMYLFENVIFWLFLSHSFYFTGLKCSISIDYTQNLAVVILHELNSITAIKLLKYLLKVISKMVYPSKSSAIGFFSSCFMQWKFSHCCRSSNDVATCKYCCRHLLFAFKENYTG